LIVFQEAKVDKSKTPPLDIQMIKPNDETKTKERRVPRKPEPPKAPPPPTAERVQTNERPQTGPVIEGLKITNVGMGSGGDGIAIGGVSGGFSGPNTSGGPGMDSEAIPVATLPPRYPREAAQQGIEGVVCFKLTVGPDGAVQELEQTSAKPPRVFDQEARRALLKWKFKPSFVDGKPVAAPGKRFCLDFKLDKSQ
jgi:protein TonB